MNQNTADNIVEFLKSSSLNVIKSYARRQDIALYTVQREPVVFAHWSTLVLVSSGHTRVIFKTHFMSSAASILAARIYGIKPNELSADKTTDFFREYCNLIGGDLKVSLIFNKQNAAVSLPILTRGFDQIFYTRPTGSYQACWKLAGPEIEFFCSTQIELLKNFEFVSDNSEFQKQKGEVEFI